MGLNVLFAIHDMRSIWDVRYWEVSPYKTVGERERERERERESNHGVYICICKYTNAYRHID